jgi:hypothetical protein
VTDSEDDEREITDPEELSRRNKVKEAFLYLLPRIRDKPDDSPEVQNLLQGLADFIEKHDKPN